MRMSDFVVREAIVPELSANSKDGVIREMIASLRSAGYFKGGEPVFVFFLLISPQDRPGDHLRALENVSRCLRDDGFVRALRQATSREAIWELLQEGENPTH